MNIISKIKSLNLTDGEYVVVGSGILDVLNLRKANDIDIVVMPRLHEELRNRGGWEEIIKYGRIYLKNDGFEIIPHLPWDNYKTTTEEAIASAVIIEDVFFMNLDELCRFKTELGREKDFKDIELIKKYQKDH